MSVLALSQAAHRTGNRKFAELARDGQTYLLSRRCCDGGWNHGGSSFRSENATSYPEMTGLALLALAGVSTPALVSTFRLADTLLVRPESSEGLSWLQMGLRAHRRPIGEHEFGAPARTIRETSIRLLALAAANGKNRFLKV